MYYNKNYVIIHLELVDSPLWHHIIFITPFRFFVESVMRMSLVLDSKRRKIENEDCGISEFRISKSTPQKSANHYEWLPLKHASCIISLHLNVILTHFMLKFDALDSYFKPCELVFFLPRFFYPLHYKWQIKLHVHVMLAARVRY